MNNAITTLRTMLVCTVMAIAAMPITASPRQRHENHGNHDSHQPHAKAPKRHDHRLRPMDAKAFKKLMKAVNKQRHTRDKLAAIHAGSTGAFLTSRQVLELMRRFRYDHDRLAALRILAPRIIDSANTGMIIGSFPMDKDRRSAAAIMITFQSPHR